MELIFKYYIDIVIAKEGFELDKKSLRDMTNIIKKVHHLNKNEKTLALSFPNYQEGEDKTLGNVVRLFAKTEKELLESIIDIKDTWHLLHLKISSVKEFKLTNKTVFYEFVKFQVPRVKNKTPSLKFGYREERKTQAENYPYVLIDSSSTNQKYSLIIQRKKSELFQGKVNSYGLSSSAEKVSIPVNID